jgi:ABC-type phosphate/phosphonate transport system substrate-binding protein
VLNPLRKKKRHPLRLGLLAVLGAMLGALTDARAQGPPAGVERETLRLGFTYSMFAGVNENDARASIKALAATVSRERDIPVDTDPVLFNGTDVVATAVRTGEIDAIGMTMDEYWVLAGAVRFDRFLMAVKNDDPTEVYVLLAHRASGLTDLASLRGKRLAVFANPRMCLGPVWLEVVLSQAGLSPLADYFGSVTEQLKLSKPVLDVFFQKADACLVTRRGFETMCELNPQVGAQLVVLASSSPVVPSVFAMRADFSPQLKEKCLREFAVVHTSPAGQQALTIFQVGQVAERPVTALASALALLDDYARLQPAASAARVAALRRKQAIAPANARP